MASKSIGQSLRCIISKKLISSMVEHAYLALGRLRQEDQEFKATKPDYF
jgi:hypothetical protein